VLKVTNVPTRIDALNENVRTLFHLKLPHPNKKFYVRVASFDLKTAVDSP